MRRRPPSTICWSKYVPPALSKHTESQRPPKNRTWLADALAHLTDDWHSLVGGAPQGNTVITQLRDAEILVGANASRTMERYPALCVMFEPALNWSSHWYAPYARPALCDPSPGATGLPRNVPLSQCSRVYGLDGLSNGVLGEWCNLSLVRFSLLAALHPLVLRSSNQKQTSTVASFTRA